MKTYRCIFYVFIIGRVYMHMNRGYCIDRNGVDFLGTLSWGFVLSLNLNIKGIGGEPK